MKARTIETFALRIRRAEVLRMLGLRSASRPPRGSILRRVEEMLDLAPGLVEPQAVMRLDCVGLPGSDLVPSTLPFAAVACTVGPLLERRVSDLAARGDATGAMILDAIGSAAVEELADASNRHVCDTAIRAGRRPARRRSPGYHPWDVTEQRLLFGLLEPADIGVSLTTSCMMIPRKSISFVVPLDDGWPDDPPGHRCSRCGLEDCPYREDEER